MIIPYQKLSPRALRGLIVEVVTRDGTEATDAEDMVAQVMRQLEQGKAVIACDLETMTYNIVPADSVEDEGDA